MFITFTYVWYTYLLFILIMMIRQMHDKQQKQNGISFRNKEKATQTYSKITLCEKIFISAFAGARNSVVVERRDIETNCSIVVCVATHMSYYSINGNFQNSPRIGRGSRSHLSSLGASVRTPIGSESYAHRQFGGIANGQPKCIHLGKGNR